MREKIIFDGLIEGAIDSIEKEIQLFYAEVADAVPDLELTFETIDSKYVWIITPENSASKQKMTNGYSELFRTALESNFPTRVRIVSCREELDLFYFQLSHRIQAKYVQSSSLPNGTRIPAHELVEKQLINPQKKDVTDEIRSAVDIDNIRRRYGTEGKMTKNEIRRSVKNFWKRKNEEKVSLPDYYKYSGDPVCGKCAFWTYKQYVYNPKYRE